jgi:lipoate-protein ligase A
MSPDEQGPFLEAASPDVPAGKWIYIDSGGQTGKFNMNCDSRLVTEFILDHRPTLRFYTWEPYCISLGRNQEVSDIDAALAEQDGIDVVIRPTGGKAVLHAEELTYSVVMDANGMSVRESYNLISRALSEGLRNLGADLDLAQSSPDFRKLFHDSSTIPCFSTSAVYEVEWHGRKLIGSAQHRFGSVLLQHGSILVGDFHKQIVKYLNVDQDLKQKTRNDLDLHTVTLTEILARKPDPTEIKAAVRSGFESVLGADFYRGSLSSEISEPSQDFDRRAAQN